MNRLEKNSINFIRVLLVVFIILVISGLLLAQTDNANPTTIKIENDKPLTIQGATNQNLLPQQLIIPFFTLLIACCSLFFSMKSWYQTNRPILIVQVTTADSGNVGTFFDLLVENTGNRPAKRIKLKIDEEDLRSAFSSKYLSEDIKRTQQAIKDIFFTNIGEIPVLANGKKTTNSLGFLSAHSGDVWEYNFKFDITVEYFDLKDRKYKDTMPVRIWNDSGFAGTFWSIPEKVNKDR